MRGATLLHPRGRIARALRYAWAAPNTLLGLLLLPLAATGGGGVRRVAGVVEIHGRSIAWLLQCLTPRCGGGGAALTLGHVVVGRDRECLERTRAHERVHVRQYERWGPFFLPAYLLSSLVALLLGRDPYLDNRFEREAFRDEPSRSRSCRIRI